MDAVVRLRVWVGTVGVVADELSRVARYASPTPAAPAARNPARSAARGTPSRAGAAARVAACREAVAEHLGGVDPAGRSELGEQRPAVRGPVVEIPGERGHRKALEPRRHVRADLVQRRRVEVAMHRDELERLIGLERKPSGQHPEQDHAERVDVAGGERRLPGGLLGRDVRGRSEHRAGLGERARVAHVRDPEVGDLRASLAVEEDVCRLEVAVDQPVRVRVSEPVGEVAGDPRRLLVGERAVVHELLLERPPGQELEHHVRTGLRSRRSRRAG